MNSFSNFAAATADKNAGALRAAAPTRTPEGDCRQRRARLYGLLLLSDAILMGAAFLLADLIRFGALTGYGMQTFMVLLPIYVAIGFSGGSAWSIEALSSPRKSAFAAIRVLLTSICVATVVFFTLKVGEEFSRLVLGIGSGLSVLMIACARLLLGKIIGQSCSWTFRREYLLLDGEIAAASKTEKVVDAGALGLRPDSDDPAMLDRLARQLQGAERVTIACPAERRHAWARALAGANANVEVLVPELDLIGARGLTRHGDVPALLVCSGPLRLRDQAVKRAFDLLVSASALLVSVPLLLLIAGAIRIESKGPVLFRQARMGRGNQLFTVLKFRTMRDDLSDANGHRSVGRGDERVTPLGRLLRRTSLDELPQLINVLKGEMSIVGPRPHPLGTRAEGQLLWRIDERYWNRHAIKPGLTGLAQVRGLRGETVSFSDVTERVQADLEYVDGWHIGRDLGIMLRTLKVLVHRNAF